MDLMINAFSFQLDKDVILQNLNKGKTVDDSDENGISLLHLASATGAENILKFLLVERAEVDKCSNLGWTPLMHAARNGQLLSVQLLLENGANVCHKNKLGFNVLSLATACGRLEIFKIFLSKLQEKEIPEDDIIYSLHIAALQGHTRILQLLLQYYPHLIDSGDKYGITPLMLASLGGHEEIIKILLNSGANGNLENILQFTAFDFAAAKGYRNLMCILREKTTIRNHSSDHNHYSDIGSDLIELYGWSSICTPKLKKTNKNSRKRSFPNEVNISPGQISETSSSQFKTKGNKTFCSSPIHISVYHSPVSFDKPFSNYFLNNINPSLSVPVPPVSPYKNSTLPFHFSKSYPQDTFCKTVDSISPYNETTALETSLPQKQHFKSSNKPFLQNPTHQEKNIPSKVKHQRKTRENISRARKIEIWLRSLFTPRRKKEKSGNRLHYCDDISFKEIQSGNGNVNSQGNKINPEFQETEENGISQKWNPTTSSTLITLLVNLNLQKYIPLFQKHEVDMDSFFTLGHDDLEEIGITSPSGQSKLLKVIRIFKEES